MEIELPHDYYPISKEEREKGRERTGKELPGGGMGSEKKGLIVAVGDEVSVNGFQATLSWC